MIDWGAVAWFVTAWGLIWFALAALQGAAFLAWQLWQKRRG